MSADPVRLGYVGCGFMAQNVHLPNFAALDGCELVALAEVRPRLAARVAARYGIPRVYRDHLALAEDPEVEAVALSGPFDLQGDVAADLLRAGKHVFMEKPMAVSLAQAERTLAAASDGNAELTVAYTSGTTPARARPRDDRGVARERRDGGSDLRPEPLLRRELAHRSRPLGGRDDGRAGRPRARPEPGARDRRPPAAAGDPYRNLPDWLSEELGTFYVAVLQNWTHNVNLLRYLLDAGDAVRVRAVDLGEQPFGGVVVLDVDGVRATIEIGRIAHHHWDEHTTVYFERGWVEAQAPPFFVKPSQSRIEIYEGGERHTYRHPLPGPLDAWPYRQEAAAFVASLRGGEPSRSGGQDTLADVRFFEDVFRRHLGRASGPGTGPGP